MALGRQEETAVRLGERAEDGIAPAFCALLERGAHLRPELAEGGEGTVELRFPEGYPPVSVRFAGDEILVRDGGEDAPDLVIEAGLPDLVHLTTAPSDRGWPKPPDPDGRIARGRLARGRIRLQGSRALGRRLLRLLAL